MFLQGSGGSTQQQNATSSRNSPGSSSSKYSQQRHDGSGKVIRSILSSKEGRQSQSYMSASMSEQAPNSEDRRPPRPPNNRLISKNSNFTTSHAFSVDNDGKRLSEDRVAGGDLHNSVFTNEKHDKRMKNKDRPDRGVWRRSDISHGSDGMSVSSELLADSLEGISISQQATVVRVGDGDKATQIVRGGRGGNSLSDMTLGSGEMKSEPNPIRIIETKSTGTRLSSVENG